MDISNNDASSSTATGSRRKSGRAVRAPDKFIPNAPSSQQGHGGSKRKRGEAYTENDASDVEDEAEEEASDTSAESADEEEIRASRKKSKKGRKPAAKKTKVNGTSSHVETSAVKLPARPKKTKRAAIADNEAEGLYGKMSAHGGIDMS
jgi:cohesin complex subunit SA-1/2